jgi:hypothetical protein
MLFATPTRRLAATSHANDGATDVSATADAETMHIHAASRLRSKTSPSGTNTSMPRAVPAWVIEGTRPTCSLVTPNVRAISPRSGWQ